MEKTLTALPGLFLQSPGAGGPAAARASFSSRLGGLIRGITALTSKHVSAAAPGGQGRRGGPRAGRPGSRRQPRAGPPAGLGRRACRPSPRPSGSAPFLPGLTPEAGFPQLPLTLARFDLRAHLFNFGTCMCFLNVEVGKDQYTFHRIG